jgi:hypothetical protein
MKFCPVVPEICRGQVTITQVLQIVVFKLFMYTFTLIAPVELGLCHLLSLPNSLGDLLFLLRFLLLFFIIIIILLFLFENFENAELLL